MLWIKHLHHSLDGKYFIFLAYHILLKGFFLGKKAGWPVHPKNEIVCKVKDNVDILPPAATGIAESLQKERESPSAVQEWTQHLFCAQCTLFYTQEPRIISNALSLFCLKYFQRWWGPEKSIRVAPCKEFSPSAPPQHCCYARGMRDQGLISCDLKIFIVGHTHPQNKAVHRELSGLHCHVCHVKERTQVPWGTAMK